MNRLSRRRQYHTETSIVDKFVKEYRSTDPDTTEIMRLKQQVLDDVTFDEEE